MPETRDTEGVRAIAEAHQALRAVSLALEKRFLQDWEAILTQLSGAAELLTLAEALAGQDTRGKQEYRAAAEAIQEEAGRLSLLMQQKAEFLRQWQEEAGICFEGYLRMGTPGGPASLEPARWEA